MTNASSFTDVLRGWLRDNPSGSLRDGSDALTKAYRAGGTSANAAMAAYVATRAPATYASVSRALQEVVRGHPAVAPRTMLDVGAGAGSATWAALAQCPEIATVTLLDNNPSFLALAEALLAGRGTIAANYIAANIKSAAFPAADFTVMAYVLAECAETECAQLAARLWAATGDTMLIVEPGTPAGFARIRRVREALLKVEAHIIAPCTHAQACPIMGEDWCHFSVRLARSRDHMHAKQASVPFEDEPFSYLAVSRTPAKHVVGRIVRPPVRTKSDTTIHLCTHGSMQKVAIPKRNAPVFKRTSKLAWGDVFAEEVS